MLCLGANGRFVYSIGNAKISGMEVDLSLSSNEYSIALVVFFVGYVVFEVPSKYDNAILGILHQIITANRPLPAVLPWADPDPLFFSHQS
jgi:phenolic acid decarboxylase